MSHLPDRKQLPHGIPLWASSGSCYFITLCANPKGRNQLAQPIIANAIFESFLFNMNRGTWWADLLVLMPDHLHALMYFAPDAGIKKSITTWKHYISRSCHIDWQRDFFEHRLRNDENYTEKASYIRMNPVRAELACSPDEWPYAWTFEKDGEVRRSGD
jgi:putative transposase